MLYRNFLIQGLVITTTFTITTPEATATPWSALSNYHKIHATKLPTDSFVVKAFPTDSDNFSGKLTVEWRENPENPVHNLIPEYQTHLQLWLFTTPELT